MSWVDDVISDLREKNARRGWCEPPRSPQSVKLIPLGKMDWKRARHIAYEIQRLAPPEKNCFLHDNGNSILVTCDDGIVSAVAQSPDNDGLAFLMAADGLVELGSPVIQGA